jgi:CubicO group peptidase (beta-lactamase class C family)
MKRRYAALAHWVIYSTVAFAASVHAAAPAVPPAEVGLSAERLERVTELMQRHIDAQTFSGAVTLIARNGRVAHLEAQGLMDVETKRPMQTDAVFRIMSMTKPVVGFSILMLVEEGKVRLTDPVGKFIPELQELAVVVPNSDGLVPASPTGATVAPMAFRTVPAERPITIRDLLTHTSGLMSGGASAASAAELAIKPGETLADVLPRLRNVPLDFQPGTRWAYSAQFGFDVLARVVEVASGTRFDRFVEERIFAPLGMDDTYFYRTDGDARVATLYRSVDGKLRRHPEQEFVNGAYFSGGGGLLSTAEDYLRFASMLLNGGQLDGKRLVGRRVVELMQSAFIPDSLPGRISGEGYGLGVRVVTDAAARNTLLSDGSFGWSGAFNTHFFIEPKENIVAIFMTQVALLDARGEIRNDFETAVMQALIDDSHAAAH